MKILDFIMGIICVTGCTVIFMIMSLVMYMMTLWYVLYLCIRRKGKFKTEINELNRTFIENIKYYFHKYL